MHGPEFGDAASQQQPGEAPAARTSEAARAWEGLVRAAYGIDEARAAPPVDGRGVAEAINNHPPETEFFAALEERLSTVATELKHESGDDAQRVRRRISELTAGLSQKSLTAIVSASGDPARKRELLDDAAESLDVDAVLRILTASAEAAGFELSRPLVRLLYKMAVQTRVGPPALRAAAESQLRAAIKDLIGRWWLIQSSSVTYGFDEMFANPLAQRGEATPVHPEPERMVLMALEVDAVGVPVWGPITVMLADNRFRELLDLLRRAPENSKAARQISNHLATPQRLSALLAEEEVDFVSVDRLVDQMGDAAIQTLLDRLATAENRATRRGIFDRLVRIGPSVGPVAFERLDDDRWFVQRNVLALLAEMGYWPENQPVERWIRHDDPRVRKEAIRTMLAIPKHRDRTIADSLRRDTDRSTLRMVIAAARKHSPDAAVPMLVKRLNESTLSPDLEVAAIRVLGDSRSTLALEALLRHVVAGRTLFGKPKLADKTSAVLAALRALARAWPDEPRVAPILERAAKSKDPDIAAAAQGRGDDPADPGVGDERGDGGNA